MVDVASTSSGPEQMRLPLSFAVVARHIWYPSLHSRFGPRLSYPLWNDAESLRSLFAGMEDFDFCAHVTDAVHE